MKIRENTPIYLLVIFFLITGMAVSGVNAKIWSVSDVAGGDNVTGLPDIVGLSAGDTIRIWGKDGYVCEGGITVNVPDVTIKRWEGSPVRPVITAPAEKSAISITATAHNTTLQGLNISGNSKSSGNGAGVIAAGSSGSPLEKLTIDGCNITGNCVSSTYSMGGGFDAQYVDHILIRTTAFSNNTAPYGGGSHFFMCSDAVITHSTYSNNIAPSEGGGCRFAECENATIADSTYSNNTAPSGGGCYLYDNCNNATITGGTFTNNTATMYGGGCYIYYSSNATITGTSYTHNIAAYGGGCYLSSGCHHATIADTTYTDNTAYDWGGGCCIYSNCNNATITGGTFTNNRANNGGGLSLYDNSNNAIITDSEFTNNTVTSYGGGCYIKNNCNNATITDVISQNNTASDIYSESGGVGIVVNNLTLQYKNTTRVSFTFDGDMDISGNTDGVNDPAGYCNINHYVKVKAPGWIHLNVSYDDNDVAGLDLSSLAMWNYGSSVWSKVPGTNGVNAGEKYVYANLTGLTDWNVLAPMGEKTFVDLAVWNVSKIPGNGNYTSMSDIPEIGEGDTVRIWGLPGEIYDGGITIDNPNVTIKQWEGSPVRPVITNTMGESAITITPGADNTTLCGLNISNNRRDGSKEHGAGVNASGTVDTPLEKLTIDNCNFMGNAVNISSSCESCGGGLYAEYVNDTLINKAVFSNNSAFYGGGCYFAHCSNASITNTPYTENSAYAGAGCYFVQCSNASITNSSYTNNTSEDYGGGCYFDQCSNAAIINTSYTGNTGTTGGGCYFQMFCNYVTITDSSYTNNSANPNYGGGCCFANFCNNATITNTSFTNNTAGMVGGGCGFVESCNNATITNSSFTDNKVDYCGGGCCIYSNCNDASITGTSYINNTAASLGGGCCFVEFCNNVTITDTIAQKNRESDFSSDSTCTGLNFNKLFLGNEKLTCVSFTYNGEIEISGNISEAPDNPAGYYSAGNYVKVKAPAPGWILLNMSYSDDDLKGLNPSLFSVWNYTDSVWSEVPGTNGVNIAEKYVYANLTQLGSGWNVIAPLMNVTGELRIESSPAGGWIWIDGVNRSVQTNNIIDGINPDVNHNVTVVLPGYYTGINESVNVSKCGVTDVFFSLVHESGGLQINSTPCGAAIYLNGTLNSSVTNTTLSDLDTGVYNVTVLLDGYEPGINKTVVVEKGVTTGVSFDLVHESGGLQINSSPAGAVIYLNGTLNSYVTNTTLSDLDTGVYNVTVLLDDYEPGINKTVVVEKGVTTGVSFDLIRETGNIQINSSPAGAAIYLNGTLNSSVTNTTLSDLYTGVYNVTVLLDDYEPGIDKTVVVEKGITTGVSFDLVHESGGLQINSTPCGAAIYLNGTLNSSVTNTTLSDLDTGVYNVTVLLDGYEPGINKAVVVENGVTTGVSFDLIRETGGLQINSSPAGAAIYLNGTLNSSVTNTTLSDLYTGVYNVTVLLDDYEPGIDKTVVVEKGITTGVSFDLVHESGGLQINSTPAGAAIYLNGTLNSSVTNTTLSDLDTGVYNVTVLLDDYEPGINKTVFVEKGVTAGVSFALIREAGNLQINSIPAGGAIYLNGTLNSSVTNTTLSDLDTGVYNVTVLLDDYEPGINKTVVVENGVTTDVSFDLIREAGNLQINSIPAGGAIYLNGTLNSSVTNTTLSDLDTGVYNVTVLLDDYEPGINKTVVVENGVTTDVLFDLIRETGNLQINSSPAGGAIYLNGTLNSSVTNTTLSDLDTGTYNVTVLLDGYEPGINKAVVVEKGVTTDVSFDLIRETGNLQINSSPAGAAIYLNGVLNSSVTNTTLSNLETGVYNVTVAKAGYGARFNTGVMVEKGKRTDVLFNLVHDIGSIQISTSPDMADIYLDGEYTGKTTNNTLSSVPTGTHNVTVVKPGYFTVVNKSVTVTKGNVTDVFSGLTQHTGNISVSSSPAEAWIWLDGVNRSVQTNSTLENIPAGSHEIVLKNPLYNDAVNTSVQVSLNQTTAVFFNLTAKGSKPVSSFTATPLSGEAPLRVSFTDASTCDPQEWNWSFGDGNYSVEQNPVHTYAKEGTYDVRLTAGNPYGNSTITEKDCVTVSGITPIQLYAPSGRIPAGDTVTFPVEADGLDNITELNFTISYDTALITVEDVTLPALVQDADFDIEIDNIDGIVRVGLTKYSGITAGDTAPVADIVFRATDSITGLREISALNITHADARTGGHECQVIRTDGAIDVEARTAIGAPNGTLPVESSKYLTVNVSNLNEVEDVSFLMEFNRTAMFVTDVRANDTLPGLAVDSVIRNDNGWLQINVTSGDNITTEEPVSLVDINVHSKGLPCDRELRLVNILWTRKNATYSFDDMHPGYISITPVDVALRDEPSVSVENLTYDDVMNQIAINVSENRNATITADNRSVVIKNPGIDITLHTTGMENESCEWNGTCTGADIGNISNSVDLSGDVGGITANISFAELSGDLSGLTDSGTGLNITITRGAVNESVGRLFQCVVLDEMDAELEEVAYTMEINKSALGGITVSNATIVMTASVVYVDSWGGPDSFRIISMSDDGELSLLETTYTREGDIFVFTALSPEGFSSKILVSATGTEDPDAEFSAVPVTGDAPLSVQFYDYSAGHPDSWLWDLGDGNTSVEQNPAHTYSSPGEYDVCLTITNVNGESSFEKTGYITVENPMTVDFGASRNKGYTPLTISFTDRTAGNPDSWLWNFGDGQTSAEQNPVHTYRIPGTYTVSLEATNAYGSVTAKKAGFITVYPNGNDGDDDDSVSIVVVTPTATHTEIPVTATSTPEPTVTETPEPVETSSLIAVNNSTMQIEPTGTTGAGESSTATGGVSALWLWGIVIIAVVAAGVMVFNRRKKDQEE